MSTTNPLPPPNRDILNEGTRGHTSPPGRPPQFTPPIPRPPRPK